MGDLGSTAKAPPMEGPSSYQEHQMFMRFDRQPKSRSNTPHQSSQDATGTPFGRPGTTNTGRTAGTESNDFREQADGAP